MDWSEARDGKPLSGYFGVVDGVVVFRIPCAQVLVSIRPGRERESDVEGPVQNGRDGRGGDGWPMGQGDGMGSYYHTT